MRDGVCFEKENAVANDTKSATTWCGKQDLLSPVGSDRVRLWMSIGHPFTTEPFKSCPISVMKNRARMDSVFHWCGKQDLNLHEIAFTRT